MTQNKFTHSFYRLNKAPENIVHFSSDQREIEREVELHQIEIFFCSNQKINKM